MELFGCLGTMLLAVFLLRRTGMHDLFFRPASFRFLSIEQACQNKKTIKN